MAGVRLIKNVGDFVPTFSASAAFRAIINPPAGVMKGIYLRNRGQHTTDITTAATDGEWNYFSSLQVTVNRKNAPPIIWNALARDLKWITALFDGTLPENANPATAGSALANAHYGQIFIPFAPPDRLCNNPDAWGIPTEVLDGPVIVEGTYGAAADVGTGATAIANRTSATLLYKVGGPRPATALGCSAVRLAHESDARLGPDPVGVGNLQALAAIYYRLHDNSATAAQRVNGIITRLTAELSPFGILHDDLFIMQRARTQEYFGLSNANMPAGVATHVLAPGWDVQEMPMLQGRQLTVIHDSAEATPDDVTAVTPTTSDAVYAVAIGAQVV